MCNTEKKRNNALITSRSLPLIPTNCPPPSLTTTITMSCDKKKSKQNVAAVADRQASSGCGLSLNGCVAESDDHENGEERRR